MGHLHAVLDEVFENIVLLAACDQWMNPFVDRVTLIISNIGLHLQGIQYLWQSGVRNALLIPIGLICLIKTPAFPFRLLNPTKIGLKIDSPLTPVTLNGCATLVPLGAQDQKPSNLELEAL